MEAWQKRRPINREGLRARSQGKTCLTSCYQGSALRQAFSETCIVPEQTVQSQKQSGTVTKGDTA